MEKIKITIVIDGNTVSDIESQSIKDSPIDTVKNIDSAIVRLNKIRDEIIIKHYRRG